MVLVEDSASHVNFGSSVPLFALQEIVDQHWVHLRRGGQDLCRNTAYLLVAFAVKGILAKHQAILHYGLETSHPLYPSYLHLHPL
jgi:hypothetical protein